MFGRPSWNAFVGKSFGEQKAFVLLESLTVGKPRKTKAARLMIWLTDSANYVSVISSLLYCLWIPGLSSEEVWSKVAETDLMMLSLEESTVFCATDDSGKIIGTEDLGLLFCKTNPRLPQPRRALMVTTLLEHYFLSKIFIPTLRKNHLSYHNRMCSIPLGNLRHVINLLVKRNILSYGYHGYWFGITYGNFFLETLH